CLQYNTGPFTF
nr:immunoglobulin light chain junction region [Macaca mulatta]